MMELEQLRHLMAQLVTLSKASYSPLLVFIFLIIFIFVFIDTDKTVIQLEYESYIPMAEKVLSNLIHEARTKWDLTKVAIYHRTGTVPVGETSVVVAISSIHRQESLHA